MALLAGHKVSASPPLPIGHMNGKMLRPADDLKIARGIVERVVVYVVDMLIGGKLAPQEPLHYEPMFRFIVSMANSHVPIPILDVLSGEDSCTRRRPVPSHKGVMVPTQPLGNGRVATLINGADRIGMSIWLPLGKRISVLVPSVVVHSAQPAPTAWAATNGLVLNNTAGSFLSWHGPSIARRMQHGKH